MDPSILSKYLRRIAAGLDSSDNPSRHQVLGELRKLIAAMNYGVRTHKSGDPKTFGFEVNEIEVGPNQYRLDGVVRGKPVNGTLTIYTKDGSYNGYDWDGNRLDSVVLQQCLDFFEDRF